jgi:hypothetical protein
MAKAASTGFVATKKTRERKPQYFLARVVGNEMPIVMVAHTQKAAFAALVKLEIAEFDKVVDAVRKDCQIIDLTKDAAQSRVDRAP